MAWENDVKQLRKDIFLAAYSAGAGHLASAFSCVEIIYSLYCAKVLNLRAKEAEGERTDKFILSKGHGSLALYSVLCMAGYFPKEKLMDFSKPLSLLGGEPSFCPSMGIEASTGSLGHGLSVGAGMALAKKKSGEESKIYVLLGDGECQEGSVWEGIMTCAKYSLDNLVAIIDYNNIQKMGSTENIGGINNLPNRFAAFGWNVLYCDGHKVDEIVKVLSSIEQNGKPSVVFAKTIKGKGCSLMENNPSWHWRMPNKKELKIFMNELDISQKELEELCKEHI